MPIENVDAQSTASTVGESAYSGGSPFTAGFKMLTLEEGQTYQLRLLPPNWHERFGKTNRFAVKQICHGGVGSQAQELCSCPTNSDFNVKVIVKCGACAENGSTKSERSKLKLYYYANCILLSNNTNPRTGKAIPRKNDKGKFIVYTIRMAKTQVYDVLATYYGNPKRAVPDICNMKTGCAISITAIKKAAFKNYQTQILEASKADLTPYVDVNDIKDLRFITEYVPTEYAMKLILGGTSVKDAMEVGGKISTLTGEQVGGHKKAASAPANTASLPADVADMDTPDMSDPMGVPGADDFLGPATTTAGDIAGEMLGNADVPVADLDDLSAIGADPSSDLSAL